MVRFQTAILPILASVCALCAFIAGYGIAVGENHVDPWLPFISDCGTLLPERMVFGQLINLSAFFLAATVYLMERNISTYIYENSIDNRKKKAANKTVMIIGLIAALGASMVGNFPESDQLVIHSIGAFMFFIGITIYFWGLLFITYSLKPKMVPVHLTNFRLLLTFSLTLLLIFHMICLFVQPFVSKVNGKYPEKPKWDHNIERPNSTSPFYANHLVSALSEWLLALFIMIGILTFSFDFAATVYHAPRLSRSTTLSKDNVTSDTAIINQTETTNRLQLYDAYAPYPTYQNMNGTVDHYAESSCRLPRVDKLYTPGTVKSTRTGTVYTNGYQQY